MKREIETPETFFKHNFPRSEEILKAFDGILISELKEVPEAATVTDATGNEKQDAKVYEMDLQVPGITEARYSKLRFIEVERKIYWVPFGW